ncbi:uncharacterized protein EDB91DRAFT_1038644, partial [Suillus paluster]|uniref:uncharacterized protein n=1 Tax=Suillus paluster TaxID=48578 RepID=UPI001B8854CB
FKTNAVRCTWFSCRREFFSGLIGALKGHINAWLRGLIHRDTSDDNTWFWVPIVDQDHAVPNWCIDEGVPKFCGETGTFPYSSVDREHPPNICHDLESFIFLAFVLRVNVTGPYHQLQDW